MKLLFIGDIIGESGRKKIIHHLPEIIAKEKIFFVIAQGENLAGGIGITEKTAKEILKAGVDCITTGNHVWKHKEMYTYLRSETRVLRPANYPEGVPGRGHYVFEKEGIKVGVINLMGRVFMNTLDDPFRSGMKIIEEIKNETRNIFIDFHAEATAEKMALAHYLAEHVTGFIGTHTHVQTSDERIIEGHCAYITDAGMVGSLDSIIGVRKKEVIEQFLYQIPRRFKPVKQDVIANSIIIESDQVTGKAISIRRYNF